MHFISGIHDFYHYYTFLVTPVTVYWDTILFSYSLRVMELTRILGWLRCALPMLQICCVSCWSTHLSSKDKVIFLVFWSPLDILPPWTIAGFFSFSFHWRQGMKLYLHFFVYPFCYGTEMIITSFDCATTSFLSTESIWEEDSTRLQSTTKGIFWRFGIWSISFLFPLSFLSTDNVGEEDSLWLRIPWRASHCGFGWHLLYPAFI